MLNQGNCIHNRVIWVDSGDGDNSWALACYDCGKVFEDKKTFEPDTFNPFEVKMIEGVDQGGWFFEFFDSFVNINDVSVFRLETNDGKKWFITVYFKNENLKILPSEPFDTKEKAKEYLTTLLCGGFIKVNVKGE
jgi:hypothetical protein